jgi:hypothetical protein
MCVRYIRGVNAHAPVIFLSAKSGLGMSAWFEFLLSGHQVRHLENTANL